jgi:hypothetical protein
MKKLICYTGGGLCNRILPLASFIEFSKITNRELFLYWPVDRICSGEFNNFFENNIPTVNEEFLNSLTSENTEFYCTRADSISNEVSIYNRNFLSNKATDQTLLVNQEPSIHSNYTNIVACTPLFLNCISPEKNKKAVQQLVIKKNIKEEANRIAIKLGLSKNIIGAHLRGADFNKPFSLYENQIRTVLTNTPSAKIFVSTGDRNLQNHIVQLFSDNIITRPDKVFIEKYNIELPWINNVYMSADQIRDAIIDVLLLSKTNFKLYDLDSTFAKYVTLLDNEVSIKNI